MNYALTWKTSVEGAAMPSMTTSKSVRNTKITSSLPWEHTKELQVGTLGKCERNNYIWVTVLFFGIDHPVWWTSNNRHLRGTSLNAVNLNVWAADSRYCSSTRILQRFVMSGVVADSLEVGLPYRYCSIMSVLVYNWIRSATSRYTITLVNRISLYPS